MHLQITGRSGNYHKPVQEYSVLKHSQITQQTNHIRHSDIMQHKNDSNVDGILERDFMPGHYASY